MIACAKRRRYRGILLVFVVITQHEAKFVILSRRAVNKLIETMIVTELRKNSVAGITVPVMKVISRPIYRWKFNIFVLAHKNANEPAGVLPLWQNSGSSCIKCHGRCNTTLMVT
jgi:hypothetical protein